MTRSEIFLSIMFLMMGLGFGFVSGAFIEGKAHKPHCLKDDAAGDKTTQCLEEQTSKVRCFLPTDDEEPPHDHDVRVVYKFVIVK